MTSPILAMLLGATALKVGEKAPDFTLPDTDGQLVTLSRLLEKGPVILAFYPKAFTPGCTQQNQNFRDHFDEVSAKGAQVVGISVDDVETQRKFKEKYQLPFPLLSDKGGVVSEQYSGKMPLVGLAKRANIVVGEDGLVKAIVEGGGAVDPTSAIVSCPSRGKGS
ncbi:MAG TPA: peroxiredoxin [Anaeromyxobacter sp.]|nr:peroxiredoxin [Anaeromyxobacter sp.]